MQQFLKLKKVAKEAKLGINDEVSVNKKVFLTNYSIVISNYYQGQGV